MKKALIILALSILLAPHHWAQVDERIPPPAEKLEAQQLAAKFFNSFLKTRDISPLIKKLFITEFSSRLKYCRTTGECRGFGRDFWETDEELLSLKGTEKDYLRSYINTLNYLFLYFQALDHLAALAGQKPEDYAEAGGKRIELMLHKVLKKHPAVLKLGFFSNPDASMPHAKTLAKFRQRQVNYEVLNSTLRDIVIKLQSQRLQKRATLPLTFKNDDFRVYKEPNRDGFFHYPLTEPIYDVWGDRPMFRIEMIRESKKIRIVAVYIPMD